MVSYYGYGIFKLSHLWHSEKLHFSFNFKNLDSSDDQKGFVLVLERPGNALPWVMPNIDEQETDDKCVLFTYKAYRFGDLLFGNLKKQNI